MARGMQFSENFRFKWTQTPAEVNFIKFIEGRHIVNHISNSRIFTNKVCCLENLEKLNRSLMFGDIKSEIFKSTAEFTPLTFRLDVVADLVAFLNTPNTGLWMVKNANTNQGKGITMVRDIARYKDELLGKKDKWGDTYKAKSEFQNDSSEILLQKVDAWVPLEILESKLKVQQFLGGSQPSHVDFCTFNVLKDRQVTPAHPRLFAWFNLLRRFPDSVHKARQTSEAPKQTLITPS
jgi:hypothetical protein